MACRLSDAEVELLVSAFRGSWAAEGLPSNAPPKTPLQLKNACPDPGGVPASSSPAAKEELSRDSAEAAAAEGSQELRPVVHGGNADVAADVPSKAGSMEVVSQGEHSIWLALMRAAMA